MRSRINNAATRFTSYLSANQRFFRLAGTSAKHGKTYNQCKRGKKKTCNQRRARENTLPLPSAGKCASGAKRGKTFSQYQAQVKALKPLHGGFGFVSNRLNKHHALISYGTSSKPIEEPSKRKTTYFLSRVNRKPSVLFFSIFLREVFQDTSLRNG